MKCNTPNRLHQTPNSSTVLLMQKFPDSEITVGITQLGDRTKEQILIFN